MSSTSPRLQPSHSSEEDMNSSFSERDKLIDKLKSDLLTQQTEISKLRRANKKLADYKTKYLEAVPAIQSNLLSLSTIFGIDKSGSKDFIGELISKASLVQNTVSGLCDIFKCDIPQLKSLASNSIRNCKSLMNPFSENPEEYKDIDSMLANMRSRASQISGGSYSDYWLTDFFGDIEEMKTKREERIAELNSDLSKQSEKISAMCMERKNICSFLGIAPTDDANFAESVKEGISAHLNNVFGQAGLGARVSPSDENVLVRLNSIAHKISEKTATLSIYSEKVAHIESHQKKLAFSAIFAEEAPPPPKASIATQIDIAKQKSTARVDDSEVPEDNFCNSRSNGSKSPEGGQEPTESAPSSHTAGKRRSSASLSDASLRDQQQCDNGGLPSEADSATFRSHLRSSDRMPIECQIRNRERRLMQMVSENLRAGCEISRAAGSKYCAAFDRLCPLFELCK